MHPKIKSGTIYAYINIAYKNVSWLESIMYQGGLFEMGNVTSIINVLKENEFMNKENELLNKEIEFLLQENAALEAQNKMLKQYKELYSQYVLWKEW